MPRHMHLFTFPGGPAAVCNKPSCRWSCVCGSRTGSRCWSRFGARAPRAIFANVFVLDRSSYRPPFQVVLQGQQWQEQRNNYGQVGGGAFQLAHDMVAFAAVLCHLRRVPLNIPEHCLPRPNSWSVCSRCGGACQHHFQRPQPCHCPAYIEVGGFRSSGCFDDVANFSIRQEGLLHSSADCLQIG